LFPQGKRKGLITALGVLPSIVILLVLVFPLPALDTVQGTVFAGGEVCSNEITYQANAALATVNSAKAIQLAEGSPQFTAALAGYGYEFDAIGGVATYTRGTCGDNMVLGQLNVDFNLKGAMINAGGITVPVGVTVYENPQMTTVTNVTIDKTVQAITYFSGYEAQYVVSGKAQQLYEDEMFFYVPIVSWNSNCYHASPYQCEMSVWPGLSNGYGGSGFLLQSGVDIKIPCTSQTSCGPIVYTSWYEWVPHNAATPCGSSYPVYYNDLITPLEWNGAVKGGDGNVNHYEAVVEDNTRGWVCVSGWYNIASTAYWTQSIIETPSNGCCPIPTSWGTLSVQGNDLCYAKTPTCVYWSNSNVQTTLNTMYNYCTSSGHNIYNINVGTTINFGGTYTQQYNNNCDF
jgi:hypothetical protein